MWTPAAITSLIVGLTGLLGALGAFLHSVETRKQIPPPPPKP